MTRQDRQPNDALLLSPHLNLRHATADVLSLRKRTRRARPFQNDRLALELRQSALAHRRVDDFERRSGPPDSRLGVRRYSGLHEAGATAVQAATAMRIRLFITALLLQCVWSALRSTGWRPQGAP